MRNNSSFMIRQGNCFHYVLADPASSLFINSAFQYGVSKRGGDHGFFLGWNRDWIASHETRFNIGMILILTFLLLVMGGLLSGWTVKNCSHCGSELIPRNSGMSPFLRVSPAMVLILLSGVCWKLVQDSNTRFTTCVFTIGISALILLFVIYFRRKCLKISFRTCRSCGRKPDLGVKQFF